VSSENDTSNLVEIDDKHNKTPRQRRKDLTPNDVVIAIKQMAKDDEEGVKEKVQLTVERIGYYARLYQSKHPSEPKSIVYDGVCSLLREIKAKAKDYAVLKKMLGYTLEETQFVLVPSDTKKKKRRIIARPKKRTREIINDELKEIPAIAPAQAPFPAIAPAQVPIQVIAPEQVPIKVIAPEQVPIKAIAPEQARNEEKVPAPVPKQENEQVADVILARPKESEDEDSDSSVIYSGVVELIASREMMRIKKRLTKNHDNAELKITLSTPIGGRTTMHTLLRTEMDVFNYVENVEMVDKSIAENDDKYHRFYGKRLRADSRTPPLSPDGW